MTGHYEPVEEISKILDEYQEKTGIDIPIHVDAASGGFIAPFTHARAGGAKWNFELPRVVSINASGHKYGLVCPGVGWIIWRDESRLPESLVFTLDYLGGQEKSFTLNFSRPGAQVIVQYYNLIHLGFTGYREIMENCLHNARLLSKSLEATSWFTVLSDIHRRAPEAPSVKRSANDPETNAGMSASTLAGSVKSTASEIAGKVGGNVAASMVGEETSAHYVPGLPIVAFRLCDEFKAQFPHIQQSTVSFMMRAKHWIIPNYKLPPNEEETEIMRIVVRENMTYDIMDRLLSDLGDVIETLMKRDEVDLSLLQQKRNKVELKSEREKKGESFSKRVENETRRLVNGNLHKSVC
jgi:glutamate decarboxylase